MTDDSLFDFLLRHSYPDNLCYVTYLGRPVSLLGEVFFKDQKRLKNNLAKQLEVILPKDEEINSKIRGQMYAEFLLEINILQIKFIS